MHKFLLKQWFWIFLAIGYVLTHVLSLTLLPVFADEAIYIRWSQLILEDPARYAFFSMNDGKTPLFIWLEAPVLAIFFDPVFAARLLSVGVGIGQIVATVLLLKSLGASGRGQKIGALLVVVLPYWYLHHRLALMDGLLALWLTLFSWGVVKLSKLEVKHYALLGEEYSADRQSLKSNKLASMFELIYAALGQVIKEMQRNASVRGWILLTGLFLGFAFWTKLPAVLFIPAGSSLVLTRRFTSRFVFFTATVRVLVSVGVGIIFFLLLSLHPSFAQLFNRGSDFLLSGSEIATGLWVDGVFNIPSYISYFVFYLTPGMCIAVLAGVFLPRIKRRQLALLLATLLFVLPIALLGKVVYARYLLPAVIFLTAAGALSLDALFAHLQKGQKITQRKVLYSVGLALLCTQIASISAAFLLYSLTAPSNIPFVPSDRAQYLTEWSSGHGLTEVYALLQEMSESTSVNANDEQRVIAVATEGYFGTLPDGLVLYNYKNPLDGVYIEGIGQPVAGVPDWFIERAREYQKTLLVVNSHRLLVSYPDDWLIAEYCRPFEAPCLQVWDVTEVVRSSLEVN